MIPNLITKEFIQKANIVHSNKFTYSKTSYINNRTKVTITCKTHGDFEQIPNSHLGGSGCHKCYIANKTKPRIPISKYTDKAKIIFGNRYTYTRLIGSKKVEIMCRIHGISIIDKSGHLQGQGCLKCGVVTAIRKRRLVYSEVVSNLQRIHKYYTYYPHEGKIPSKTNIPVLCTIHNKMFYPQVNNHLRGSKCPLCSNLTKGSSRKKWKDKLTTLYVLRIKDTEIYKIGITRQSLQKRFSSDYKAIDVLYTKQYIDGVEAFDIEQRILKETKLQQYQGKVRILQSGNTELRTTDLLKLL